MRRTDAIHWCTSIVSQTFIRHSVLKFVVFFSSPRFFFPLSSDGCQCRQLEQRLMATIQSHWFDNKDNIVSSQVEQHSNKNTNIVSRRRRGRRLLMSCLWFDLFFLVAFDDPLWIVGCQPLLVLFSRLSLPSLARLSIRHCDAHGDILCCATFSYVHVSCFGFFAALWLCLLCCFFLQCMFVRCCCEITLIVCPSKVLSICSCDAMVLPIIDFWVRCLVH